MKPKKTLPYFRLNRNKFEAFIAKMPRPENLTEFSALSGAVFALPLTFKEFYVNTTEPRRYQWSEANGEYNHYYYGRYEIAQDYESFCPGDYEYDAIHAFMEHVLGRFGTGGIARSSYGSFYSDLDDRARVAGLNNPGEVRAKVAKWVKEYPTKIKAATVKRAR